MKRTGPIPTRQHPLYSVWQNIRRRCGDEQNIGYKNYGGRGIRVCDEWRDDFWQFVEDMGERPDGYTIERVDNEKGYSAANCRWATMQEQSTNRRIPMGESVPNSKLTSLDAETILALNVLGFNLREIHEKFPEVSYTCVGDIIRGRTWKQVA